jgi:hypothetical protein
MRMDIEISPGARGQRNGAAARDNDGLAPCEGRMNEKRLCSMNHPANIRGERASRFLSERAMGVLWRHSNVNLVEQRPSHWPPRLLRRQPKITKAVSIPATAPQPAQHRLPDSPRSKFTLFSFA